jgi:Zn-finger nucleic acid-binding protein
MQCPGCGNPLEAFRAQSLELDRCPRCGVLWFDAPELRQFLISARSQPTSHELAPVEPPLQGAALCPRCEGQPLERVHWRGIPLAFCAACSGVLLTQSALAAIRVLWARTAPRPPVFELPRPEGADDPAQQLLWAVVAALGA